LGTVVRAPRRIWTQSLCDEVGGSADVARWHPVEVLDGLPRVELVDAALVMAGVAPGA